MVKIVSPNGWMGHPKGSVVDLDADFADKLVDRKVAVKKDKKKADPKKEIKKAPKDKMVRSKKTK